MKIAWFSLWISRALLHNVRNYLLVVIASISGRHCTYKVLRPCLQNLAATSTCYKMGHCRRTIMNKHWEFASEKYGQFVFYLQTMVLLLINLTQCMILVQYYWYDNVCMKPSNTVEILKPRQNGSHFADDSFKCIFLNDNFQVSNKVWLQCVLEGLIDCKSTLFQIMTWCWTGNKPLSVPMGTKLILADREYWWFLHWN